jgi:lysozyme
MKTSINGRKLIEQYEGLILTAYDDATDHIVPIGGHANGTLTIGYGHTDAAGPPKVYVGQVVSKTEADSILASDLTSVEIEVNHLVKVSLNQNQFDSLVSFQFNTGALAKSTLLVYLNKQDWFAAANEFTKWNKARGKVLEGLVKRRASERSLFLTTPDLEHQTAIAKPSSLWQIITGGITQIFS